MQDSSKRAGSFNPYAPPTKEEQIALANAIGPADETALEQLAQFADYQADIGEWHVGHLTAQRLRLLAQVIEGRQEIGPEERDRLRLTMADLARQVDELSSDESDSGPIELVIRFASDGPGTLQVGDLHVMVSLLAGVVKET